VAKHKIEKGEKMKFKTFKKGFTLAELLTAIAIIAILIGILMPALNMARKFANDTKQKAMLSSIETGILMFKNDTGEYPRSKDVYTSTNANTPSEYCGSQILAECMLGQDLLGFHPSSKYEFDAWDSTGSKLYYDPNDTNLRNRKSPYLNRENIGVFKPVDIFDDVFTNLEPKNYLICDVYTAVNKTITLPDDSKSTKKFKMGTPILYFRADTSGLDISDATSLDKRIYNFLDNWLLVRLGKITNTSTKDERHLNFLSTQNKPDGFYKYITDDTATTTTGSNQRKRPVRPDSFLLISAGADGLYGTTDDICNFTPNIQ